MVPNTIYTKLVSVMAWISCAREEWASMRRHATAHKQPHETNKVLTKDKLKMRLG